VERLRRIEDEEFKRKRRGEERKRKKVSRKRAGEEGWRGGRRVIYIGRVTGGTFTPDKGQFSPFIFVSFEYLH